MPLSEPVPPGWLPRARVLEEGGIDERTLNNWRMRFLIPRPVVVGKASYYRPETIAIIRRLKTLSGETHSADDWLWRLWFEGFLVEMQEWATARLNAMWEKVRQAGDLQSREAIEAHSVKLISMSGGRIRQAGEAVRDLADILISATLGEADASDFASKPFDVLLKVGGLPLGGAFQPPDGELIELLSLHRMTEVIADATEEEMEQASRDAQAIARLIAAAEGVDWHAVRLASESAVAKVTRTKPEPASWRARKARRTRPYPTPAIVSYLSGGWRSFDQRALLLAFLIGARQPSNSDPGRSKRITEILTLAELALSLFPRAEQNSLAG
jgi:hypothetical protein